MSHKVKPMLAKLGAEPFDDPEWIFEVKWDGYRAIAEIESGAVDLYSRNHISFVEKYPPIIKALKKIKHECILDGEIIALKGGKSDFHSLQYYGEKSAPLEYAVFDLLYLDGKDLRDMSLIERKSLLKKILPKKDSILLYSEHVEKNGKRFFTTMASKGLEGMVAKNARSTYQEGKRTGAWRKVKNQQVQEAIIVGFTEPRNSRKFLGALVLAAYEGKKLVYIGHSGGGFTQKELRDLCTELGKIKRQTSPLQYPQSGKIPINMPVTWVEPKYVCEIQFTEWTPEGHMRHPIYKGLRMDKRPKEVMREIATPAALRSRPKSSTRATSVKSVSLSHLDKVFWPEEGYTKGDLIRYYDEMAEVMMPHLVNRPQNLNRHPNGWKGKNFYQKNITNRMPDFVRIEPIYSESNKEELHYLVCDNKETLLYMANLGCIEINPWSSRLHQGAGKHAGSDSLNYPDFMIIDLDPDENSFEAVIAVAQQVHSVLQMACEQSFVKTSGKTGIHIAVPLDARHSYEDIRQLAELIARLVHQRMPDSTSIERSPAKRRGKIYLDYLQNGRGQTIAAPYSVRPFAGATVSTPLEWGEVRKGLLPAKFTIKTIAKRLSRKGDLWKGLFSNPVNLTESIRCLQEGLENP